MFRSRKKEVKKDEAQLFLESVSDEPEMPDPNESADEALDEIARKDAQAHYDIVNLLILAVIVIFFGVVLLTLTNRQDFSNENRLTKESFFSGNYLARAEKNFNDSIPLQDYLHNVKSYIKYCFGIGNSTDIIDIKSKKNMDDPYSIENEVPNDEPLNDSLPEDDKTVNDSSAETQPPQEEEEEDVTNRKIDTIRIQTQTSDSTTDSEEETTTTTNNRAPSATTTTTVPPQTETSAPDTEPPVTDSSEPDDSSQPSDSSESGEDD